VRSEFSPQTSKSVAYLAVKKRRRCNALKGSQRMGGEQIFSLFLMTYRMSLISAGSISLEIEEKEKISASTKCFLYTINIFNSIQNKQS
jgi:hypothetical protein